MLIGAPPAGLLLDSLILNNNENIYIIDFLINGFSNHEKEKLEINDVDVFVHTWDVARLFKINESNSVHEPIGMSLRNLQKKVKVYTPQAVRR